MVAVGSGSRAGPSLGRLQISADLRDPQPRAPRLVELTARQGTDAAVAEPDTTSRTARHPRDANRIHDGVVDRNWIPHRGVSSPRWRRFSRDDDRQDVSPSTCSRNRGLRGPANRSTLRGLVRGAEQLDDDGSGVLSRIDHSDPAE